MVKDWLLKSVSYVLLFMISSAQSSDLSSHIRVPVTKYQLENGMRVLLNPNNKSSICSYLLGVSTGSRHEREGITGISHMFEHLMFKGTKRYPQFFKTHSENGIIGTNAFTSYDYTGYKATFPCDKLDLILDMESDRLVNLTFTQDELDRERQAVQEERRLRVDNSPTGQLSEVFFRTLFVKHPYRWPVIGYAKDIAAYTLKDLGIWYKTYYSPNNSVLALSGNFSESKAKKLIEKYFGDLKPKEIPKEVLIKEPEQIKTRHASLKKDVQSPYVIMGFKIGTNGTKEALALKTVASILGSGESSRLYKKLVREKKLVSSISAYTIGIFQENVFSIVYPLLDRNKEAEVRSIIQQEIQNLFTEPIGSRELGKMKNIQLARLVSRLKTSQSRVHALWEHELLYQDYKKIYTDIDEIDKLSPQYLQEVSKKYLSPEKMSYVILESTK